MERLGQGSPRPPWSNGAHITCESVSRLVSPMGSSMDDMARRVKVSRVSRMMISVMGGPCLRVKVSLDMRLEYASVRWRREEFRCVAVLAKCLSVERSCARRVLSFFPGRNSSALSGSGAEECCLGNHRYRKASEGSMSVGLCGPNMPCASKPRNAGGITGFCSPGGTMIRALVPLFLIY